VKLKCWICLNDYEGEDCPICGPPEPWGPTPEELKRQKALPEQSEADHVWNTGRHSWDLD